MLDQNRLDHELALKQQRDEYTVNINLETHQFNVTHKTLQNKADSMNSNIEDVTRQLNSYDVDNMNLKNSIEIQNAETKIVIQNVEN